MSDPTTHVEQFGGSLGAFAGVDPIRFADGLWLEQATTNYFHDPDHRNSGSWIASGGTLTHNNVAGDYYHEITAAANDQGARTANAYVANPMPGIAGAWTFATDILLVSGDDRWSIRAFEFSSGGSVLVSNALVAALNITGNWVRYVGTYTPSNPSTAFVSFSVRRSQGGGSGGVARVRRTAIEQGGIATSQCPEFDSGGTILSGYAFTGTAHASTSTRAAASAAISPTGILDPATGSLAFRLTRKVDTGAEEIYGECGEKAASTDHLRWGVDASDHPFVEWSSNNAAYQRLTGTETISVNTEYLFYLGWNGVLTELSIDAGTKHTGTRDVVEDDFSVGDLTLEASAGGVIVSPFATFDRPLTDTEIATLAARQGWSMSTLDSTTRRIRAQFELRPAY